MRCIVTFGLCALVVPVLVAGQTKDDFEYWDANNNGDLTCGEALGRDEGLRLPAHRDNTNDTAVIYEWLSRVRGDSDNDGVDCESENNPNGYIPNVQPVAPQGCPADAETWRGLQVCEEQARDGYNRNAFGTGYSSLEDDIIAALPATMKAGGQVYTPYSCIAFDITADGTAATDIEHIVALAEAHDSRIADDRRRDIASDLDNLTIADPSVNRAQKSDRDAGEWMPAQHGAWFAERVIAVKQEYGLSVDRTERNALERLLAGGGAELNCVAAVANRAPQPVGTIPAQTLQEGDGAIAVNVAAYFRDPDGDPLTYTAVSSSGGVVTAGVAGSTVTLTPVLAGTATVTVTVRDPAGLSATQAILVTVSRSVESDRQALETLYDATDGPNWMDSTNWKTVGAPLNTWYGVTTDTAGRVTRLELGENGLTGSLPPALGSLVNLEWLYLWGNELTGPIPDELGSLANLERLILSSNELTGPIPDELRNLTQLEWLYLWGNELTGPVPAWLGSLTRLQRLLLSNNNLTGPIPDELGSLLQLEVLYLWGNELTGPVPAWLGNLTRLQRLILSSNDLTGPIPDELRNLTQLELLYLWGNELTGPVPAWLGSLTRLQRLSLSWNALTGPIPDELRNLTNLELLVLSGNELTGPVPKWLGNLTRLRELWLRSNDLTGPVPGELGSLPDLELVDVSYNWGLSGPLPPELRQAGLESLDIFLTPTCAPAAWQDWLETIEFYGRLCDTATDATIDVAVLYTPAARAASGSIEAVIDLMVAETNQAFQTSGVHQRIELVERSEVPYTEAGDSQVDLNRLRNPSDGYMDEVHALRDRVGADLVHLIVNELETDFCGRANIQGPFGVTGRRCGGRTFAHELGHNLGLRHDRYRVRHHESGPYPHPAYGYVNQQGLLPSASSSSRWRTIMSYPAQCDDDGFFCTQLLRFSNPRQTWRGDPLGVAYGAGGSGLTGPADAAAVIDNTGPAVALWRDHVQGLNRPPETVGALAPLTIGLDEAAVTVDVSGAFRDPDGDALTYGAASSAPSVASVAVFGSTVTVTPLSEGSATVTVTATDAGGSNGTATQPFAVTVGPTANRPPEVVGVLAALTVGVDEAPVMVEVSGAFRDPDGDLLTYGAASSSPSVALVAVSGSTVTVTPLSEGSATVTVTATDAGGSNGTATQTFAVAVGPAANRPPEPVGVLPPLRLGVDEAAVTVEVASAFRDPDGDALTYRATSSALGVVTVQAAGARVTLAAVGAGTAAVEVTATDPDGLSATQTFRVRVTVPFTDDPIVPGVTPVRAVHFTELRTRIDVLRSEAGLAPFRWADPVLRAGVTPVRLAHLLGLREALGAAYTAAGQAVPGWTDPALAAGSTPIRAAHLTELRAAVLALE